MPYQVIVLKKAKKEINRIPNLYRQKIIASLSVLSVNPHSGKKLSGRQKNRWSLKAWPYRIIYEIRNRELIVLVIKVAHRQNAYK